MSDNEDNVSVASLDDNDSINEEEEDVLDAPEKEED